VLGHCLHPGTEMRGRAFPRGELEGLLSELLWHLFPAEKPSALPFSPPRTRPLSPLAGKCCERERHRTHNQAVQRPPEEVLTSKVPFNGFYCLYGESVPAPEASQDTALVSTRKC
jgi:hypothetical protein